MRMRLAQVSLFILLILDFTTPRYTVEIIHTPIKLVDSFFFFGWGGGVLLTENKK